MGYPSTIRVDGLKIPYEDGIITLCGIASLQEEGSETGDLVATYQCYAILPQGMAKISVKVRPETHWAKLLFNDLFETS